MNNLLLNKYCIFSTLLNPYFKNQFYDSIQISKLNEILNEYDLESIQTTNKYSQGKLIQNERNKTEYQLYIEEEVLGGEVFYETILDYWEGKKYVFPKLYKLSREFNGYLCSSCSSERLFSDAGNFLSCKRTRMLFSTVESQCVLRHYILNEGIEIFLK